MKTLFTAATIAAAFALVGCNNNKTHDHDAAPGATSGECCGSCTDDAAAPGAVSAEGGCATSCSDKMPAAPGAVSAEGGCASSCATSCSDKMPAAPGAVSSDDCSGAATSCPFSGDKG